MKTERNGILEIAWRKFKAFVNTPLFDFLDSVFMFFIVFVSLISGVVVFPSVESIFLFFLAGVCFASFLASVVSLIYFLLTHKPSAEADKNKNENKE